MLINDNIIELKKISKIYPKNVVALDNIDLTVKRGEFVSLVGRSGAGKSTLIKLLIAEEKPTSGRIIVDSFRVQLLKPKFIPFYRRQLGVIFQDFKLLSTKTVYENVAYAMMVSDAPYEKIKKQVPQVLKIVGLLDKKDRFPRELSSGEQQRVGIARSLVNQPKILLADEPTGNLDAIHAAEIVDLLVQINQYLKTTIILATHDKDIVNRIGRRVVTLVYGRIVKDQPHGRYTI